MASYMLLAGPSHGLIAEATEGEPIQRPAPPTYEDLMAGRLENTDPGATITYRPWSLSDRLGARFLTYNIMLAEGTSDLQAVMLFRDIVQRFQDRATPDRPPEVGRGAAALLTAIDQYLEAIKGPGAA